MAEEIHHRHDLMVHAVLSDVTEASSFLQAYLPGEVSQELNWSTLRLVEGSFVDEALRGSEAEYPLRTGIPEGDQPFPVGRNVRIGGAVEQRVAKSGKNIHRASPLASTMLI